MPSYFVQIEGQNFLVDMEGKVAKYGFITHRVVEASAPKAAENDAVQLLREDACLRPLVKNDRNDPPVMNVTELVEIGANDNVDVPTGFIWYEMNPRRWWQFWRR